MLRKEIIILLLGIINFPAFSQITNLSVCDFTQAEILWDRREEIQTQINSFKTCTDVNIRIVLAYQNAPEELQTYVSKWEEEGNGVLIAFNPYGTNFENDLKIVYSNNVINKTPGRSKQWLDERIFRAMMFVMIPILSNEDPLAHRDYISVEDDGLPGGVVGDPGDVTGVHYQYAPRLKYGIAIEQGIQSLKWGCSPPAEEPLELKSIIMENRQYTGGRTEYKVYTEGTDVILWHDSRKKKFMPGEKFERQFPEGSVSWELRSYHDNSLLLEFNNQNTIEVDFENLPWGVLLIAKYQEQQLVIRIKRHFFRAFPDKYRIITEPVNITWQLNSVPDYEYNRWAIKITTEGPLNSTFENINLEDQPFVWKPHYRDLAINETYPPGVYKITVRLIEKATQAFLDISFQITVDGGTPLEIKNLYAEQVNPWIATIGGQSNIRKAYKGQKLYVSYHPVTAEFAPSYKPETYVIFEPVFNMPVQPDGRRIPEDKKFWNDQPHWTVNNSAKFLSEFKAERVTGKAYGSFRTHGLRAIAYGDVIPLKHNPSLFSGDYTSSQTRVSYSAFNQTHYIEVVPVPYVRTPVTIDFIGSRLLKKQIDIKKWVMAKDYSKKMMEKLNGAIESIKQKLPEDMKFMADVLLKVEGKFDITFNAETLYEERPFSPLLDTTLTLVITPSASLTLKKEIPIGKVAEKIGKAVDRIPVLPESFKKTLKEKIKLNAGISITGGGSSRIAVDFYKRWLNSKSFDFDMALSNTFGGTSELAGSIYAYGKLDKIEFDFPVIGKKEIVDASGEARFTVKLLAETTANQNRDKLLTQFCFELPRRFGIEYGLKAAGFTILEKQFWSWYDFTDRNRQLKICSDPFEVLDIKSLGL